MNLARSMTRLEAALKSRSSSVAVSYDEVKDLSIKASQLKLQQDRISYYLSSIPAAYQGKTFADAKEEHAEQLAVKKIVMRYAETFVDRKKIGNNLIFSGKSGTGKTFLSFVLYQALAKAGHAVRYELSLLFLRKLRDLQFVGESHFQQALKDYQQADFLILDEGTEGLVKGGELCPWEKEMLFTIINLRYQHNLCTLLLTNLDNQQFEQRLTERIAGRLLEKGIILAFNWPSYRGASDIYLCS